MLPQSKWLAVAPTIIDQALKFRDTRQISYAEEWHRQNGIFLAGHKNRCQQSDSNPDNMWQNIGEYAELYPHIFNQTPANRTQLNNLGMPWFEWSGQGPFGNAAANPPIPEEPNQLQGGWNAIGYGAFHELRAAEVERLRNARETFSQWKHAKPRPLYFTDFFPGEGAEQFDTCMKFIYPYVDVIGGQLPFLMEGDELSVFVNCDKLKNLREVAQKYNKSYWMWCRFIGKKGDPRPTKDDAGGPTSTESVPANARLPSASEMLFQMYVPLTFGVTGIIDYFYDVPAVSDEFAYVMSFLTDKSGKKRILSNVTETFQATGPGGPWPRVEHTFGPYYLWKKALHEDVKRLSAGGLSRLRNRRVEQLTVNDSAIRALGLDRTLMSIYAEAAPGTAMADFRIPDIDKTTLLLVGRFQDKLETGQGDDGSYFMITNTSAKIGRDGDEMALSVKVTTRGQSLRMLDRKNGQWSYIPHSPNGHVTTIPGGTGELFKIDNGQPIAP